MEHCYSASRYIDFKCVSGQAQYGHGTQQWWAFGSPDTTADGGAVARATGKPDAGPVECGWNESDAGADAEPVARAAG